LATSILNNTNEEEVSKLLMQSVDLAKLSQGILTGQELTNFIKRSAELLK
jgi:molecular chaperone HtpG